VDRLRRFEQEAHPIKVQTVEEWKRALEQRGQAELAGFIVEMASANRSVRQTVQARFDLDVSIEEVIADTRTAIRMATDFDERDRNTKVALPSSSACFAWSVAPSFFNALHT
jgi:hypothetical protein